MKYQHLTIEEREKIQLMWWKRESVRVIAEALNRSPSSISRELRRNFPPEHSVYTPRLAHERALKHRKHRDRTDRLKSKKIRSYVTFHLKKRWSPEQISGRIKIDIGEQISHEAIYQFVYGQVYRNGHGYLRPKCEDLRSCLRRKKKRRTPKGMRRCQRILKPKGTSIDNRPKIVEKRKRIGDWEGDSVESLDHKPGLNTVVERKIGLLLMTKLKSKTSLSTVNAMKSRFINIPNRFKRTITLDNGPENRDWKMIEKVIDIDCYFAHAYHSWERGTNENTNGLIRDYFPKKTDFSTISDEEIKYVENELNSRPRKRLGWKTPLEAWGVALES